MSPSPFSSPNHRATEKVRVGSNKTILGIGSDSGLKGAGLHLRGVHNILIRNLSIHDSDDDAVNIEDGAHHIWIDHCDFSRCHDGLVESSAAPIW